MGGRSPSWDKRMEHRTRGNDLRAPRDTCIGAHVAACPHEIHSDGFAVRNNGIDDTTDICRLLSQLTPGGRDNYLLRAVQCLGGQSLCNIKAVCSRIPQADCASALQQLCPRHHGHARHAEQCRRTLQDLHGGVDESQLPAGSPACALLHQTQRTHARMPPAGVTLAATRCGAVQAAAPQQTQPAGTRISRQHRRGAR